MLATAIIVFREVLEAALIVSIVMAAAKGMAGRNGWVAAGIAAGLIGASLVAAFAEALAEAAAGMGQELFNATILFAAVLMLGWHNVWMSSHGREMAKDVNAIGSAVRSGARPLYALAVVIGVAVLREGSETVLFLYGIASSGGGEGATAMLTGGVLGILAGVGVGAGLYFGLLRIPMRHLFTVTNWMILLLAAGMASQAAGFLVQADLLPSLGSTWDTSWLLTENGVIGRVLHTLVGYVSRPAGIQVLFYLTTLITIETLTLIVGRTAHDQKVPAQ
jgi:high-affinity iron transporter